MLNVFVALLVGILLGLVLLSSNVQYFVEVLILLLANVVVCLILVPVLLLLPLLPLLCPLWYADTRSPLTLPPSNIGCLGVLLIVVGAQCHPLSGEEEPYSAQVMQHGVVTYLLFFPHLFGVCLSFPPLCFVLFLIVLAYCCC